MSRHMRTTVRLDDALLEQAKREAVRRKETLTSLMEQGLRLVLAPKRTELPISRASLPIWRNSGGTLPGVDISNSASLLDIMESDGKGPGGIWAGSAKKKPRVSR